VHPFDLRAAILARHAQHVVIIHFPLALFTMGALFDCMAQLTRKPALASAAYYNFLVSALSSPFAVVTGLLAWRFQLEGQRLQGILLMHLVLGSISAALICLVWWLHFRDDRVRVGAQNRAALDRSDVHAAGLLANYAPRVFGYSSRADCSC